MSGGGHVFAMLARLRANKAQLNRPNFKSQPRFPRRLRKLRISPLSAAEKAALSETIREERRTRRMRMAGAILLTLALTALLVWAIAVVGWSYVSTEGF